MLTTPEPPALQITSPSRPVLTVETTGRIHGPALTRVLVKVFALSAVTGGVVGGLGGAAVRWLS